MKAFDCLSEQTNFSKAGPSDLSFFLDQSKEGLITQTKGTMQSIAIGEKKKLRLLFTILLSEFVTRI